MKKKFSKRNIMNEQDLCCLHKCPNGQWLQLALVSTLTQIEAVKKSLEIDVLGKKWRYFYPDNSISPKDWNKIGESSNGREFVVMVFDPKDSIQLEKAFSVASHFYSNNDQRE
jgi:hypothetical protein